MVVTIRKPEVNDKNAFLQAMHHSQALHHPWVQPPQTEEEFNHYLQRYQQDNQICSTNNRSNCKGEFPSCLLMKIATVCGNLSDNAIRLKPYSSSTRFF
jgi:hypothetical protein